MSETVGVVVFVVLLMTSVMLHEFGHFLTAKAFRMKASRFFVGFGPTIWSFQKGETEYGIKAIPAGGFVKIEGMTQLEELAPEDEPRAFWRQPSGKRTIVLAAGSFVHFVIAIVLVFGYLAIGHTDPINTVISPRVAIVEHCVSSTGHCKAKDATQAPAEGELKRGDLITLVNGTPVEGYQQLQTTIQQSAGKPLTFLVLRKGESVSVTLTPKAETSGGTTEGKIGFVPAEYFQHVSLARSFPRTLSVLGTFITETGSALGDLPHELSSIFHNKSTGTTGATSVVGIAEISGSIAADHHQSLSQKIGDYALIVASLNLFVGIFNLLPLLPLDGGHIAILAYEGVRSRAYKLFRRPDPGRVDILKVVPLTYAVFAVFVGISLLLLYSNIVHPLSLQ